MNIARILIFILKNPMVVAAIVKEVKSIFDNSPRSNSEISKLVKQISSSSDYGKLVEYLFCLAIECKPK